MKTISGLFDDYDDAARAVRELEALGVPNADISIVASNSTDWYDNTSDAAEDAKGGAGIGAVVGGAGGLLTGLGLMAIPGVGPVVAAGWLAATAVGALGGAVVGGAAGGIVGALTDSGVTQDDAHVYAEGVRRGGTLVTARVDDVLALDGQEVLDGAKFVDLDERRSVYKEGGWNSFDPTADRYTAEKVAEDRARRTSQL